MKNALRCLTLVIVSLLNSVALLQAQEVAAIPVAAKKVALELHAVTIELIEVDRVALRKAGVDWQLADDDYLVIQPIKAEGSFLAYLKLLERNKLVERISTPAVQVKPRQAASFKYSDDSREVEISVQSEIEGDQVHGMFQYKCFCNVGSKPKAKTLETGFTCQPGQRLIGRR